MRIHYLQHVPFEDLANIGVWAAKHGHAITGTRLFCGDPLPAVDSFDLLVVLGDPMNVDEHDRYPWLLEEKRLIGQAIEYKKSILGICLGAQLAAAALGAEVKPNPHKEIGWFPVSLTDEAQASKFFRNFPPEFMAHVLAVQFHLEYSTSSIAKMLHHCGDELVGGPYVQSREEIADRPDAVRKTEGLMVHILQAIQDQRDSEL